MGTFGCYEGSMRIPLIKRGKFVRQVVKVLNYGGMMQFEVINMYGHEMGLLKPIELCSGGKLDFHFNYFEDEAWETAGFNVNEGYFYSGKIGGGEFCDVVTAVDFLYEAWDKEPGYTDVNGEIINNMGYTGWLNHLLGTKFSMKKRFRIWDNVEMYALERVGDYKDPTVGDVMQFIPDGMSYGAGGVEFSDLMYIIHGTDSLTEDEIEPGTYPADVYGCKKALEAFFKGDQSDNAIEQIWELVKKARDERKGIKGTGLSDIGRFSLILPARVIVYLTAEIKKDSFWKYWKEIHGEVYHDEVMKDYASKWLKAERKQLINAPVPPVRTSEFLRQDGHFTFFDTPEELRGKPNYYISDDDRLYWWDGTDEVILSKEMDEWLRKLEVRHKEISEAIEGASESSDEFLKGFLTLLVEIDQFYKRIYPFQNMFYEFIQNSSKPEYRAAVELLKRIADENKEEGKIIEKVKYDWDITSRNVTHNAGRLKLKRYLSVMANSRLRKKYFDF